MALIKCPECGNTFSDKATACPACGCPTSEAVNAVASSETNESKARKSKAADAAIAEAVKKTRKEADAADKMFDSASSRIQMKASREIDLFGGDAPRRIIEIRADAKRACDDLYTTYQTLIPLLDATCRPLLADLPSREAVKSVADCIKYLNDESEIENNYGLTFNSNNLGNVASAKYVPSMENKMIQKFWESKISSFLTSKEITEKYESAEERAARLKEEEARRKAEEEAKAKYDSIRLQYSQALQKWESECAQINAKRTALVKDKLAKEKEQLISAAAKKRDDAIQQANATIKQETERKAAAETALASLGAFKIGKKKEQKWTIAYAVQKISEAEAMISAAHFAYSSEKQQAESTAAGKETEYRAAAEKEIPLPAKPAKPAALIEEDKRQRAERIQSAYAGNQKDDRLKAAILEYLEGYEPMTVSDMIEEIPALCGETNQHVSALLRSLVLSGDLEKFTDKRRTYFRVPE